MNMFNNMFGTVSTEGAGDINGRLVLVEVIAALTDYTHTPFHRSPNPHLPSNLMDEMVLKNNQGILTGHEVDHYSAHMGHLNNIPGAQAKILGGYSEYNKGLMKLKFRIQNGGINDDYISVLGYITNNDIEGAISENAIFVPSFSWKSSSNMSPVTGPDGLSVVTETIGRRSDYLINDGSYGQHEGLMSMRPADVIGAAGNIVRSNAEMAQYGREGLEVGGNNYFLGHASINNVPTILSNRRNVNPTKFANTLLKSTVNVIQQNHSNVWNTDNGVRSTANYESEESLLSTASNNLMNEEYGYGDDEFLVAMRDLNGTDMNLRGWTVGEINTMFPNFAEIIDNNGCVLLDRNQYEVIDFNEIAQVFGTSSGIETIAQELIFNILDLLITNGVSGLTIQGSNCDQMATEDRLSNIQLFPVNIQSLTDNDIYAFQKGTAICDQLRNQIFNRLNGAGLSGITPIRIHLQATLFGSTELRIQDMSQEANGVEVVYVFPTFAPTPYSPVFGNKGALDQLAQGAYSNIQSYFLNN